MRINNSIRNYARWRRENYIKKIGFFPIFSTFEDKLDDLSPGAAYLYLFLGIHSNYKTGASYYSIRTLSKKLNRSERTISTWLRDLEKNELIYREQKRANSVSTTFLLPYDSNRNKK